MPSGCTNNFHWKWAWPRSRDPYNFGSTVGYILATAWRFVYFRSLMARHSRPIFLSLSLWLRWAQPGRRLMNLMCALVRLSVCPPYAPSVPCLRFCWNMKAIETSNLVEIQCWTRVTREANLRCKSQLTGNGNIKIVRIFVKTQKWIDLRQTKTIKWSSH